MQRYDYQTWVYDGTSGTCGEYAALAGTLSLYDYYPHAAWDSTWGKCVADVVVLEGSSASPALWPYSVSESADIAFQIGLLWAMCWGFKQMKRVINT